MDKIERFKNQQILRAQLKGRPLLHEAADPKLVDAMLATGIDQSRLDQLDYLSELRQPVNVSSQDAKNLLKQLDEMFNSQRIEQLLDRTRKDVIQAVVIPFGLGKILSAYDQDGGTVTTVNNAKNNIYAKEADKYDRKTYTHSQNTEGHKFAGNSKKSVGSTFTREQMQENTLTDAYTGEQVLAKETSPDHIVSLSEFHKNGGYMQSAQKKADFATDKANLASTRRDINQSMSDHDKMEWKEKKQNKRDVSNSEHFGINSELVQEKYSQGQEAMRQHLPSDLEKGVYYIKNSATTGLMEGFKMGGQQAIGVVLVELFAGVFEELKLAFQEGLEGRTLFSEISSRIKRIVTRVLSKWKAIVNNFGEGLISGLLSNIVTTLINVFIKTGKRVVRMIREGFFSLFKALKMMLFPPEHMTAGQAAHEGLKLLLSGGVVVAGVALEELIEKALIGIPLLAGLAPIITPVLVGSISAVTMAMCCYLLDKLDFFGVIRAERDEFAIEHLDKRIQLDLERANQAIFELETIKFDLLPQG